MVRHDKQGLAGNTKAAHLHGQRNHFECVVCYNKIISHIQVALVSNTNTLSRLKPNRFDIRDVANRCIARLRNNSRCLSSQTKWIDPGWHLDAQDEARTAIFLHPLVLELRMFDAS